VEEPVSAALLAWVLLIEGGAGGALTVAVSEVRSANGRVGCALYDGPKGFPTDASAAVARRWCPVQGTEAQCRFDGVAAGEYAVACFHDENGNGELDRGVFGIPNEGTGASNDAKGFLGPPKFDDAKVKLSGGDTQLEVKLRY